MTGNDRARTGGPYLLGRIMARNLVTVPPSATLQEAIALMTLHQVTALVVADPQHRHVGVLSRTDVSRHLTQMPARGRPAPSPSSPVADAMSPTLLMLRVDCPVAVAARLMANSHIHRVLVEDKGACVGMVSLTDIARLVGEVGLHGEDPATATDLDAFLASQAPRDVFAASLERCLAAADFTTAFYERFLSASPEVRTRFAGTDSKRQQQVIVKALRGALDVALGKPSALAELAELAREHDRHHHNVTADLYKVWLESLVATARELDPRYDLAVEQAWRIMLGNVISFMLRRY